MHKQITFIIGLIFLMNTVSAQTSKDSVNVTIPNAYRTENKFQGIKINFRGTRNDTGTEMIGKPLKSDLRVSPLHLTEDSCLGSFLHMVSGLHYKESKNIQLINPENLHYLNNNFSAESQSIQLNYGIEKITSLATSLTWTPTKQLRVSFIPAISRFSNDITTGASSSVFPSVGGCIQYNMADWLSVKAFGSYTFGNNQYTYASLLYPQRQVGCIVHVRLSNIVSFEAGAAYTCLLGKWQMVYYACPVIDISKHSFRK